MTVRTAPLAELLLDARAGFACGVEPQDGVFQIRMNNITVEGRLDLSKKRRVPRQTKNFESFLLEPGDVLFNATNSPDLVGKSAFFPGDMEPVVFSNHFLRLRPRRDLIEGRFLARWLTLEFQRGRFRGMCRQWVNQAAVGREALLGLGVPLLSLPEQRRVADVLDWAEALRAKRRAAIATLDEVAQSIFIDQFGDPVATTKGFPLRPLLELVDENRPITYGILMPGPDQKGGVKYVRVVDMKDGGIDLRGVRSTTRKISDAYRRSLLKAGDLLLSIRGHVGRVALVPVELEGANITQDTARLALPGLGPWYLRECLRTTGVQRWMERHTKGVAVRGLNLGDLKRLPIPVPPGPQQLAFARRVAAIEKLKALHRASLAKLDELFASLQHSAFRGEL